ncbi:ATP-binding protein [Candidatus Poriferisodalis sp.]|uniref:ATP-binding protein n=1 Tax=Candidatus Poriferisodalis sp. TaxID=3101277 RepID=UPI003AF57D4B
MVEGNGFPYRVGESIVRESQDAINDRKIAYRRRGYEQRICLDATLDDLDMGLAERFLQRVAEAGRPVTEVMHRYGLIHPGGPDRVRITNAALLLFAREPILRWHPRADARLFRVDGTERHHGRHRNVQQIAHLDLPIASMIGTLRDAVRGQVRRSEQLSDLFFEDTPEYPDFAWQEALVNAVAHRDYDDFGRGIEVWFYDDRMEVHSPGGLVPPVTLEALRTGAPAHASRNPILVRVLAAAGIMRDEGEGVPRMFREMHGMNLPPPEFCSDHGSHIVRLRSSPERSSNRAPSDTSDRDDHGDNDWNLRREAEAQESRIAQLRVRMIALGKILDDKGAVTNTDYRELFGADRRRALADLNTLVDLGWLVRRGERRGTRYVRPV